MKTFHSPKSSIHVIVRGLLVQAGNIILCRAKGQNWFFLPGGHVENGEAVRVALLRELNEEIGNADYDISSFVGVCENIFFLDDKSQQHELNIIFEVDLPKNTAVISKEEHIEFISVTKEQLLTLKILPMKLKHGLLKWFENEMPFLEEI